MTHESTPTVLVPNIIYHSSLENGSRTPESSSNFLSWTSKIIRDMRHLITWTLVWRHFCFEYFLLVYSHEKDTRTYIRLYKGSTWTKTISPVDHDLHCSIYRRTLSIAHLIDSLTTALISVVFIRIRIFFFTSSFGYRTQWVVGDSSSFVYGRLGCTYCTFCCTFCDYTNRAVSNSCLTHRHAAPCRRHHTRNGADPK